MWSMLIMGCSLKKKEFASVNHFRAFRFINCSIKSQKLIESNNDQCIGHDCNDDVIRKLEYVSIFQMYLRNC